MMMMMRKRMTRERSASQTAVLPGRPECLTLTQLRASDILTHPEDLTITHSNTDTAEGKCLARTCEQACSHRHTLRDRERQRERERERKRERERERERGRDRERMR